MLKPVIWIGSLGLAAMLVWSGHQVANTYGTQLNRQESLNQKMLMFRETYEALKGVEDKWQQRYTPVASDIDVLRLHRLMALDRFSNTQADDIEVLSVDPIRQAGTQLPVFRVCVANSSRGFLIEGGNVASTLARVRRMATRSDIRFGGMAMAQDDEQITVTLTQVCSLLRTDGNAV